MRKCLVISQNVIFEFFSSCRDIYVFCLQQKIRINEVRDMAKGTMNEKFFNYLDSVDRNCLDCKRRWKMQEFSFQKHKNGEC